MSRFLTMKEAATLTGKSPSSIRRIIYPILEHDKHPDRHHIEPDVATAKSLRLKGESFPWKISEELLRREIPANGAKLKSNPPLADPQSAAIVDILRKQLDIKDQQIAAQNDVIKGLSERVREGNILMGSLQQQLALPDSGSRTQPAMDATTSPSPSPAPSGGAGAAPPKKTHWLFRKLF